MLRSPRPTQRARTLPGVQVAGLWLCRGLCVRGQHTKTHFLEASLPGRPAHHSRPVAFLRPPPGLLQPRVPGSEEQRPCGEPSEPLAWWRRWLGLARLFRQPRRPTQQSLQSLCERQALRRPSFPACAGRRASCGLGRAREAEQLPGAQQLGEPGRKTGTGRAGVHGAPGRDSLRSRAHGATSNRATAARAGTMRCAARG